MNKKINSGLAGLALLVNALICTQCQNSVSNSEAKSANVSVRNLIDFKSCKDSVYLYKAFLLDYPKVEDKKQGKTGSAIEVHGAGSGKAGNKGGYNWTIGCVALSNENIDLIYPDIYNGDRITIVRYTDKILEIKKE